MWYCLQNIWRKIILSTQNINIQALPETLPIKVSAHLLTKKLIFPLFAANCVFFITWKQIDLRSHANGPRTRFDKPCKFEWKAVPQIFPAAIETVNHYSRKYTGKDQILTSNLTHRISICLSNKRPKLFSNIILYK